MVQFGISSLAIILAGIFLARSTDVIGELTGMGRLFAGSILLAGATSLPELMVDISAIREGLPDIAVGDLMGSSLMNLLILAIADLCHRNPNKMFSRAGAQHALSAALSINVTIIACIAAFLGPQLAAFNLGEIGIGPLAIAIAYTLGLRLVYYDQKILTPEGATRNPPVDRTRLAKEFSIYFASALSVFIAAPYLAESAGEIADISGLGNTFIGSSLVAFCTSLPEVVSTIAAIRMGAFDLAVGNIFGSNSFNMILLVPLDLFHKGNLLAAISHMHFVTALTVVLATSVAVMGQLYQVEKRKKFIEPDAFAIIGIVIGALLILYWVG